MSTVTTIARSPAPDFTSPQSIEARRRIAAMRAAGLAAGTVAVLFGLSESELIHHNNTPRRERK